MSRRIVYVFVIAGCAGFIGPASADRECFESSCRMPEVMEAAAPQPEAIVEPATAQPQASAAQSPKSEAQPGDSTPHTAAPNLAASRKTAPPSSVPSYTAAAPKTPPSSIRPQMVVDQSPPALKPLPFAPHEPIRPPSRTASHDTDGAREPVEVASRSYAAAGTGYAAAGYEPHRYAQPDARVIVVTPAYSYGGDGVVPVHKRNDPSWKLCQTERDRGDTTCSPYQYHAFGEHGYRPLGSYREQRAVPVHVYVPDARIVAVNE
jgi:hypothetical protein